MTATSRRAVLRGAAMTAGAGVAGFVLARRSDAAKARPATAAANAYGIPEVTTAKPLVGLDRLPNGGGVVLDSRRIVVTRDGQGAVRAFSATCTHQGCQVSSVQHGQIVCPCHGSVFDATTGAPVHGPARRPLREIPVEVRGGEVFTS